MFGPGWQGVPCGSCMAATPLHLLIQVGCRCQARTAMRNAHCGRRHPSPASDGPERTQTIRTTSLARITRKAGGIDDRESPVRRLAVRAVAHVRRVANHAHRPRHEARIHQRERLAAMRHHIGRRAGGGENQESKRHWKQTNCRLRHETCPFSKEPTWLAHEKSPRSHIRHRLLNATQTGCRQSAEHPSVSY